MGEIVSIHRLFQSKVLLFEREAQILTARQGIAGTTGFIGTRKPQNRNHYRPTASSDRLVHNPHPIEMSGDSMRKNGAKLEDNVPYRPLVCSQNSHCRLKSEIYVPLRAPSSGGRHAMVQG